MFGYNKITTGSYSPETNEVSEILDFPKDELKQNYTITLHKEQDGTVNILIIGGHTLCGAHKFSKNYILTPKLVLEGGNLVMTLPWYEIPQLNYPRSSCGTLVYNNKLFILYGEGSVDIPNRKKKAVELLGDVN